MKTLEDVMTRGVESIAPQASLTQAAEKMRQLNVGALPVCEGDTLVGLVTDRDLVVRGIAMGHDPDTSRVSSVMSEDVETLPPTARPEEAAEVMEERRIRRLLVVDAGKLVGLVSLGDLSREVDDTTAARTLEHVSEPSRPLH